MNAPERMPRDKRDRRVLAVTGLDACRVHAETRYGLSYAHEASGFSASCAHARIVPLYLAFPTWKQGCFVFCNNLNDSLWLQTVAD